jgi:N-acetylmuramic acid 6-phosphate (MurNAc-6-P) etherase
MTALQQNEGGTNGNDIVISFACVGQYAFVNFAVQDDSAYDYMTAFFSGGPNWTYSSQADGSNSAGIPAEVISQLNNAVPVYLTGP